MPITGEGWAMTHAPPHPPPQPATIMMWTGPIGYSGPVVHPTGNARYDLNRRLLRARDAIDRSYAEPLDIAALACVAYMSKANFIRSFHKTFGEPPHRYLQRRRIERAMALLRHSDRAVTDICHAVGSTSMGTFSRTFRYIVGTSPSEYRLAGTPSPGPPTCFIMAWTRPSSFGEAQPSVWP